MHHLVLHSRCGSSLSTLKVRSTIISFMKEINPEFHITPRDIRAIFASYMIRRYVRRRISENDGDNTFKNMEPKAVKEVMAEVMNTSVPMLEKVELEVSHGSVGFHI